MPLSHTYTSHACSHNSTVNINITYNIANSLLTVPPRDVVSECRTHLFCCMINTHVTSGAQLVMPYQHTDTSKLNVSVTKGCLVGCKWCRTLMCTPSTQLWQWGRQRWDVTRRCSCVYVMHLPCWECAQRQSAASALTSHRTTAGPTRPAPAPWQTSASCWRWREPPHRSPSHSCVSDNSPGTHTADSPYYNTHVIHSSHNSLSVKLTVTSAMQTALSLSLDTTTNMTSSDYTRHYRQVTMPL